MALFTIPARAMITVQFLMGKRDGSTFSVWCRTKMGFSPDESYDWHYEVALGESNELIVEVPRSHGSESMLYGAHSSSHENEVSIEDAYDFLAQLAGKVSHRGSITLTVIRPVSKFNINFVTKKGN